MQPDNSLGNQPQQPPYPPRKNHKKLGLWLLIGPSALFIVAMIVAFVAPVLFPDQPAAAGELFSKPNPARSIANIFVYASTAVVVLTWLPGIIAGIILVTKK